MESKTDYDSKYFFLADDDSDDCLFFLEALNTIPFKFDLVISKNGEILIQKLLQAVSRPDIIFLDLNMPHKNGIESLREIRQIPGLLNTTVVIITTSSHKHDIELLYAEGADFYMVKPSDFEVLCQLIKKAIIGAEVYTKNQPPMDVFVL